MRSFIIVFVGAGIGGALRHCVNLGVARLLPNGLGVSTLIVNVLGCFVMGLLVETIALKTGASNAWRLFLATGLLGGFTTFSAFSLDSAMLYERGQVGWAAMYVIGSVSLSIAALFAGLYLVRHTA